MGDTTAIPWCDRTWNPWVGCRKVSPGCDNCYMHRERKRFGLDPSVIERTSSRTFCRPLWWQTPGRVFVCSWSDFFIEDADQWRDYAWWLMREERHLTFLLLTKRPENIRDRLPRWALTPNIWLGVTAENQAMANQRIPLLLEIQAEVRFVSVEPMLGPVRLSRYLDGDNRVGWVICGGESGPGCREMKTEWAESLARQCWLAGVPFFMKQMSGVSPVDRKLIPENLQVKQWPKERQ